MYTKTTLLLLFSLMTNVFFAQTKKPALSEKEKIEQLIVSIEQLKNAKFLRNGSLYDATTAAKHLRMKWNKAGSKIKSAQEFIDQIASKSSITGNEYKIVFADGKEILAGTFLNEKLKTLSTIR